LNGLAPPENVKVVDKGGILYVPINALLLLGWKVNVGDSGASATLVDGENIFVLRTGEQDVTVRRVGSGERTVISLNIAPFSLSGQMMVSVRDIEAILRVPTVWDQSSRTLSLGVAPKPSSEDVQEWCKLLGIEDCASVFHRTAFRVTLKAPQGETIPTGQEFLLIGHTNRNASLQLYERFDERPPQPVFGADSDGQLVYYPRARGTSPRDMLAAVAPLSSCPLLGLP